MQMHYFRIVDGVKINKFLNFIRKINLRAKGLSMKAYFLFLTLCFLSSVATSQNLHPLNKTRAKSGYVKFSMKFIEGDRVLSGYSGHPLPNVIEAIEKLNDIKKGDYESTSEFAERKAARLNSKFLGDLSADDT